MIIENILFRHPMLSVIRFLRNLQQNSWLQLWPVLLADPSEFEFLLPSCHSVILLSTILECGLRSLQNVDHVYIDRRILD